MCSKRIKHLSEELTGFGPDGFVDAVADTRGRDFPFDDANPFQLFQMLGYGGLRQRQFIDKITADTDITFDEELQNGYPSRVCKGFGEVGYAILVVSKGFGFRKFHINRNNTIDMFAKQILLLTIT